jgi:sporulation protein YlmC with PRC-barrel domain
MTSLREVHLELLIGRKVCDPHGNVVGRLEEVRIEKRDGEHVVSEFHVGKYAMFERLMGGPVGSSLLRLLGHGRAIKSLVIPWEIMDLRNPRILRITRPAAELREVSEQGRHHGTAN